MLKTRIFFPEPSLSLAKILVRLGSVGIEGQPHYLELNLFAESFPAWLQQLKHRRSEKIKHYHVWESSQVIDATRKTLLKWYDIAEPSACPLFTLWSGSVKISAGEAHGAFMKFQQIFEKALKQQQSKNHHINRALKVAYMWRSATVKKLSNEFNIPERTLFREMQKALYEIGKNVLGQMKCKNSIQEKNEVDT
jgi:hypothetical protein